MPLMSLHSATHRHARLLGNDASHKLSRCIVQPITSNLNFKALPISSSNALRYSSPYGNTMALHWQYHGDAAASPWLCHCNATVLLWHCRGSGHGHATALPWQCVGNVVMMPCLCHGVATMPWQCHGLPSNEDALHTMLQHAAADHVSLKLA